MWIPADEENDFAAAVLDLLTERQAAASVRTAADDPFSWSEPLWQDLCRMGVGELIADGETGAAMCVANALGRQPAAVPALSNAAYVPAFSRRAGVALPEAGVWSIGPFDDDGHVIAGALDIDDGGRVRGVLPLMLDAAWADSALVMEADGVSVRAIALRQQGVEVRPRASLDASLPFADVILTDAATSVVAELTTDTLAAARRAAEHQASLWVAASAIGTAQRLLDLAVAYARQRVQFGMRIGERQAIKHKCADMLMQIESARSALWNAVGLGDDDPRATGALSLLRLASGKAVDFVAQQSLQIHGGIGFTWEHDVQLLFKRALVSRQLFGGDEHHRDQILSTLSEKQ